MLPCRSRTSGDLFDTTFGHSSYRKDLHVTSPPAVGLRVIPRRIAKRRLLKGCFCFRRASLRIDAFWRVLRLYICLLVPYSPAVSIYPFLVLPYCDGNISKKWGPSLVQVLHLRPPLYPRQTVKRETWWCLPRLL